MTEHLLRLEPPFLIDVRVGGTVHVVELTAEDRELAWLGCSPDELSQEEATELAVCHACFRHGLDEDGIEAFWLHRRCAS